MATSRNSKGPSRSVDRTSKSIYFQGEADQALLNAIGTALQNGQASSFSDLCKIALRHLLMAEDFGDPVDMDMMDPDQTLDMDPDHPPTLDLATQITALQNQVDELQMQRVPTLDKDLKALTHRVTILEAGSLANVEPDPPKPPKALPEDPVLRRLAPLLEDF